MIDATRVLRPLAEVGDAIERLVTYEQPAELAGALEATFAAVERTLRLLLRSDAGAPEADRLAALAPADMPATRLTQALRGRNLISLELAGRVHDLELSVERAARGDVRAADADLARTLVAELRRAVTATADEPIQEAAHQAVTTGAVEEPAQPVPAPRRRGPLLLGFILVLVLAGGGALVYLLTAPGREDAAGVAAFEEQRMALAEQKFQAAVQRRPDDVLALLYLGRIYRREGRLASADTALSKALMHAPDDPDVLRERGHLLMAAGQPARAAQEYERAVHAEPDDAVNWLAWIQALRATHDPRLADVIQRAPPEVRARLQNPQ